MSKFEKLGKALNEILEHYVQRALFSLTAKVYLLLGGGLAEGVARKRPRVGILLALPAASIALALLILTVSLGIVFEPIFEWIETL